MANRRHVPAVAILPIVLGLAAAPAKADQLGCTILLCMMNPAGWASVPYCVSPVQTAFNLLSRGKPLPQCPEAGTFAAPGTRSGVVDITTPDGTRSVAAPAGGPTSQP